MHGRGVGESPRASRTVRAPAKLEVIRLLIALISVATRWEIPLTAGG
jgi:hypothetical protein